MLVRILAKNFFSPGRGNELRRDDEVLTKAIKAARLFDMWGSKEEVAITFGRSTKTIDNWLKLLTAIPEVLAAVREKKISAAVGIKIAMKPREEQAEMLAQILAPSPARSNDSGDGDGDGGGGGSSLGDGNPSKEHTGVKKGWLRKAMKTDAFGHLEGGQKETLQWILSGFAPEGHWAEQFMQAADEQMGQ